MRHIIVGGGIAAFTAMKAILHHDPMAHLNVISEEKPGFYYRPMTPLVIKGDKDRDDILHEEDGKHDINLVHDRAVSVDVRGKEVRVKGGQVFPFDRLLIATGSSPVVPDIPGLVADNVFFLRTLDDAKKMREAAKKAKSAVVLGAGFVGIKMATILNDLGLAVTMVEKLDQILSPRLDREASSIVEQKLAARNIRIITGDAAARFSPDHRQVMLQSGSVIEADLICVAVGVKPNIDWLADSGLAFDKALVVDDRMRTNIDAIFGAGDVVQTIDFITGKPIVSALWTNAVDMGKVAGMNMAGAKASYPGALAVFNAAEIEGLPMISVGDIRDEEADYEVHAYRNGDIYRKLIFKQEVLTGAIFIGDLRQAGIYAALIRNRTSLGGIKAKVIDHRVSYVDYYAPH